MSISLNRAVCGLLCRKVLVKYKIVCTLTYVYTVYNMVAPDTSYPPPTTKAVNGDLFKDYLRTNCI